MIGYKIILQPKTAFGTPLVGDTLFGQLCWALRERFGIEYLQRSLAGYTQGNPFMIVSDAMPEGYVPLPHLPSLYWSEGEERDRKKLKKLQWLPEQALSRPSEQWQNYAKSDKHISVNYDLMSKHMQMHNTINRQTHTTSAGNQFAPYSNYQLWFAPESKWQVFVLLDNSTLPIEQLQQALNDIGQMGYGRDATVGLGKFDIVSCEETPLFTQTGNAVFTLARACPQGLPFASAFSFYQTETRFGRHGNVEAIRGNPFKKPILMAKTGAVFSTNTTQYIGQGIGKISMSQIEAVHQGYAPVISFSLNTERLKALSCTVSTETL